MIPKLISNLYLTLDYYHTYIANLFRWKSFTVLQNDLHLQKFSSELIDMATQDYHTAMEMQLSSSELQLSSTAMKLLITY